MPKVSRPRTEWGMSKTYYKALNKLGLTAKRTQETDVKNDF